MVITKLGDNGVYEQEDVSNFAEIMVFGKTGLASQDNSVTDVSLICVIKVDLN